jgi:hypothetical protein
MTKDGRPSRITDIRYFHGDRHNYLRGHDDAVAFGRRIAWFLNGEGFSLGAYPQLYLLLTPALVAGTVEVTDYGGDWWQRYTHVGVPSDFLNRSDASELARQGTVTALKAIRPDLTSLIEHAERTVIDHGDDLRFLLKSRQSKQFIVEVSFNISVWPQPSHLFVSLTDRSSGTYLEAPPIAVPIYFHAFDLAGAIKVTKASVDLSPNKSVGARVTAALFGDEVHTALTEFRPGKRPTLSKLVKQRG